MEDRSNRSFARWMGRLALALAALAGPAEAQNLGCGDQIPPGSNVVLSADVRDCPGPFALHVEGPATLDLGGKTITCDNGSGIEVTGRAVKIRNGRILLCQQGIRLAGRGRHRLSDLVIAQMSDVGVRVVSPSDRNRIEGVRVSVAGIGIDVVGGDGQKLISNRVFAASQAGYRIQEAGHELKNNVAQRSTGFGFNIQGARHVITGNRAEDTRFAVSQTTGDGFRIQGTRMRLTGNQSVGNTGDGFEIIISERLRVEKNGSGENGRFGFRIFAVLESQLVDNIARLNGLDGIHVADSAITRDLEITKNFSKNHAAPAFDLRDATATCDGTTWTKNEFVRAFPDCVN